MRKTCTAVLALGAWASLAIAAGEDEGIGTVVRLTPEVTIERAAGGKVIQAKWSDRVFEGDTVRTSKGARVEILFTDGTMLIVGEEAELTADDYVCIPEESRSAAVFSLPLGKVRAIVKRIFGSESDTRIVTNTAIAGVTGTDFFVLAGEESTSVFVLRGSVEVSNIKKNIGGRILLEGGSWSSVARGQAPAAPRAIADSMRDFLVTTLSPGAAGDSSGEDNAAPADHGLTEPRAGVMSPGVDLPSQISVTGSERFFSPSSGVIERAAARRARRIERRRKILPPPPRPLPPRPIIRP